MAERAGIDELDVALLQALTDHPRAGALELARLTGVARAPVTARVEILERSGVVTGLGPEIDLAGAGLRVLSLLAPEMARGAVEDVERHLQEIPGVLEAYATTGTGDVLCRVAAGSHEALQRILVTLNRSPTVVRSTSVVILSRLVPFRTLPLLRSVADPGAGRSHMPRKSRPASP